MGWIWHWAVRAPFAALAVLGVGAAAGGIIEWGLGLSALALGALVADIAHHLGNKSLQRRRKRLGIVEAPRHHSFYDFSDYERPADQRAA
jgi:hypothetical protein